MIAKCPSCGKSYKLGDHLVGKPGKCTCGTKFVIGAAGAAAPVARAPDKMPDAPPAPQPVEPAGPTPAPADDLPPDPFRPARRQKPVLAAAEEKSPAKKIVLMSLGAVVLVLVAGIVGNMLFPPEPPPGPNCDMTIAEFRERIDWQRAIVPRYDLADFKKMVGEPTRQAVAGLDAHLIYQCKDGKIHIIAQKDMYAQGVLWIMQLKEE